MQPLNEKICGTNKLPAFSSILLCPRTHVVSSLRPKKKTVEKRPKSAGPPGHGCTMPRDVANWPRTMNSLERPRFPRGLTAVSPRTKPSVRDDHLRPPNLNSTPSSHSHDGTNHLAIRPTAVKFQNGIIHFLSQPILLEFIIGFAQFQSGFTFLPSSPFCFLPI